MKNHFDPHLNRPFQTLASDLERVALRHGVPYPDCQDCAQESLLALVIAHPDWPVTAPRTIAWARGVARYKALIYHRQRRQHPGMSLEELGCIPLDRRSLPSLASINRDDAAAGITSSITDLLGHLSEVNRQIIIKRVQEGISFAEIGEALGLTANQVKARLLRAVKTLRKNFATLCVCVCEAMSPRVEDTSPGTDEPAGFLTQDCWQSCRREQIGTSLDDAKHVFFGFFVEWTNLLWTRVWAF